MSVKARFVSVMTPPPGGKYFLEINGERVEDTNWPMMHQKAAALMAKHGVTGPVEWAVAEYMCPYMPDWYCRGVVGRTVIRDKEAWDRAQKYFRMNLVTFEEVSRRLRVCQDCPKHSRENGCVTSSGILQKILSAFGGHRVRVLEDEASGICTCARTYEAVVASVVHDKDIWEGVPDTCWRKSK